MVPLYWEKHAAGSSVTFTLSIEGGHARTGTYSETLKDIGANGRTIAVAQGMTGHAQESARVDEAPTRTGTETLKIDGKEYACTVWSSKSARVWLAESVATPIKFEIVAGSETYALRAARLGEKVSAAGGDYACTVLEGELPTPRGKAKAKVWMNAEIPGMVVASELSLDSGMKVELRLKEFKIAK